MMKSKLSIRLMIPGDEQEICELIHRVFTEHVAPHYGEEGIQEFMDYITSIRGQTTISYFRLPIREDIITTAPVPNPFDSSAKTWFISNTVEASANTIIVPTIIFKPFNLFCNLILFMNFFFSYDVYDHL